jgi:hypothetical protein
MRSSRLLATLAAVLVTAAATPLRPSATRESGEAREVTRIRAHFDSVLTELPAHDVRSLSSEQRARRAELLGTLRAYRDRGVFPHNYDFPGQAVPYFVDLQTGTRCAVAHLLESTGRRDVVDRVARQDNNVWVAQLANDSAFVGWLDAHGLTLAEAARIQVPYIQPETPAQQARNAAFMTAAPIALGGSLFASVWNARGNADGHRRLGSAIGLTSGVMAMGMGAAVLGKPDMSRGVGALAAAIGATSVALAVRSIRRHDETVARMREDDRRRVAIQAAVAPIVTPTASLGAGMVMQLRW